MTCGAASDTERIRTLAAEPNGFRVHLLNHSDTVSCLGDVFGVDLYFGICIQIAVMTDIWNPS